MRRLKPVTLAVVAMLLAALPAGAEGPFTEAARLIPQDVHVYIEFRDLAGLRDDWQSSALLAQLRQSAFYEKFVSSPKYSNLVAALEALRAQYGFEPDEAIREIFGGTCAFAVRVAADEGPPATLVVLEGTSGDALRRYVDIITQIQEDSGKLKQRSHSTYAGRTITTKVIIRQDRRGELGEKIEHHSFAGGRLLVSNDMDLLKEAIDRADGAGKPTIATNAKLSGAASALPQGARILAVADMPPLTSRFLSRSALGEKLENPLAKNVSFALRSYLESISTHAVGVYVTDSVRAVFETTYSPEKITPNLRRLIAGGANETGALDILPASTVACVHVNFNPSALVAYLRDVLPPDRRERLELALATARAWSGTTTQSVAPDDARHEVSLALVRGAGGAGNPATAFILSLGDPQVDRLRLEGAIGATVAWIAVDRRKRGDAFEIRTETVGDAVIHSFGPLGRGRGDITPAYGFIGRYLVLSNSRDLVREMARIAYDDAPSLAKTAAVGDLLASGETPGRIVFLDIARLGALLNDAREALVRHQMRRGGKSQEEARAAVGDLIELLNLGGRLRASTTSRQGRLTTVLELTAASQAQ